LLNDVLPSKTSSLSLLLGSHYFNYLLDDPVHLPVSHPQKQVVPGCEQVFWRRCRGTCLYLEIVQFVGVYSLFFDSLFCFCEYLFTAKFIFLRNWLTVASA